MLLHIITMRYKIGTIDFLKILISFRNLKGKIFLDSCLSHIPRLCNSDNLGQLPARPNKPPERQYLMTWESKINCLSLRYIWTVSAFDTSSTFCW